MHVIAEFCGNWNGDKKVLWNMVEKAAKAGAKFAKIQTFYAKDLADEWVNKDYERIKKLELTPDEHKLFVDLCQHHNITPMTSIYSAEYLPMLWKAGFRWVKIGSPQAADLPLQRICKAFGFKVMMSTGGHNFRSLPNLTPADVVFHCVSQYPHEVDQSNLIRMAQLSGKYPKSKIGFSDHSDPVTYNWIAPAIVARIMGAQYLEKHFTILNREETKDGCVSIGVEQLTQLCAAADDKHPVSYYHENYPSIMANIDKCLVSGYGQAESERALIVKYKGRWKKVVEGPDLSDWDTSCPRL